MTPQTTVEQKKASKHSCLGIARAPQWLCNSCCVIVHLTQNTFFIKETDFPKKKLGEKIKKGEATNMFLMIFKHKGKKAKTVGMAILEPKQNSGDEGGRNKKEKKRKGKKGPKRVAHEPGLIYTTTLVNKISLENPPFNVTIVDSLFTLIQINYSRNHLIQRVKIFIFFFTKSCFCLTCLNEYIIQRA